MRSSLLAVVTLCLLPSLRLKLALEVRRCRSGTTAATQRTYSRHRYQDWKA
jgi:hypothetical protein